MFQYMEYWVLIQSDRFIWTSATERAVLVSQQEKKIQPGKTKKCFSSCDSPAWEKYVSIVWITIYEFVWTSSKYNLLLCGYIYKKTNPHIKTETKEWLGKLRQTYRAWVRLCASNRDLRIHDENSLRMWASQKDTDKWNNDRQAH